MSDNCLDLFFEFGKVMSSKNIPKDQSNNTVCPIGTPFGNNAWLVQAIDDDDFDPEQHGIPRRLFHAIRVSMKSIEKNPSETELNKMSDSERRVFEGVDARSDQVVESCLTAFLKNSQS